MTIQTHVESVESLHKGMAIIKQTVVVFWVKFHKCAASLTTLRTLQFSNDPHGNGGKTHPESVAINKIDSRTLANCCCCCCCKIKIFQWTIGEGGQSCFLRNLSRTKC